jgi:hypothetical protein
MEADLRRGGFLLMSREEYEAQVANNYAFAESIFLQRVRLPLSGNVASLFSRVDAWHAARVERQAQVCFDRGAW